MEYSSPEQDDVFEDGKPKRKSAKGRKLIRWDPGLDQLVLLCVDHVCTKQGIAIPWDDIGKHVAEHLTGEAIKQHLVKIYKFREEEGEKVPPKLDRNQRRKAFAAAGTPTSTPARGRSKKTATRGDDDGEELQGPAVPVKPGRTLLFKKPDSKAKRTPKKDTDTPRTPAIGRGRKKAQVEKSTVDVKSEDDSDGEFDTQNIKSVARGGKRSRKPKHIEELYEDDEDLSYGTPSKKPRTTNYLRTRPSVNYAEQMAKGYEDEADEDGITLKSDVVKKEQHSSQTSNDGYNVAPPPQYGLTTPAHTELYQGYPRVTTPGYNYSGQATPFDLSPIDEPYRMPGFSHFENHAPPPMMPMVNGNGFTYGFNPAIPPYHANESLNFGGGADYGHHGFPSIGQTEAAMAMNNFRNGQPGSFPNPFGGTIKHNTDRDIYDNNDGVLSKVEEDSKDNIVVHGMLDSTSDTPADFSTTDVIGRGIHSITPHNADGGLHFDTDFDNDIIPQSRSILDASATEFKDGETGITPALAQTGFLPHVLRHNDSGFSEGYNLNKYEHHTTADDFLGHDDFLDMGDDY